MHHANDNRVAAYMGNPYMHDVHCSTSEQHCPAYYMPTTRTPPTTVATLQVSTGRTGNHAYTSIRGTTSSKDTQSWDPTGVP